jgi:hypothetical protein
MFLILFIFLLPSIFSIVTSLSVSCAWPLIFY